MSEENTSPVADQGFLAGEEGAELTTQITRLLRDEETDNTRLLLEIIEGGGINPRLKAYVFAIGLYSNDKPTAAFAMEVLKKYCEPDTVKQLAKLKESTPYYYNDVERLGKFRNPEFDLLDFLLGYKMVHWHRVGKGRSDYFVTSHKTLNLSYYPDDVLSEALETLDFIKYITLPASRTFDLNGSFPHLKKLPLEQIFIEGVRMDVFPVILFQHPDLKLLSIKRGSYRPRHPMDLPETGAPHGCETLENLIIDGYPIANEDRFGAFPNLEEAFLQRCQLEDIEFLKNSPKLEHLNIKFNILQSLPAFISDFKELKTLALNGNPFKKLELNLEPLKKLEDLELKIQNKPYGYFRWY